METKIIKEPETLLITRNINLYTYIITTHSAVYYNLLDKHKDNNEHPKVNDKMNDLGIETILMNHTIKANHTKLSHVEISEKQIDKLFPARNPEEFIFRGIFLLARKNNQIDTSIIPRNTIFPMIYGNNTEYYDLSKSQIFNNDHLKSVPRIEIMSHIYKLHSQQPLNFLESCKILFGNPDKNKYNNMNDINNIFNDIFNDDNLLQTRLYNEYISYSDLNNVLEYVNSRHHILNIDIDILNFPYHIYKKFIVRISILADDVKPPSNMKWKIFDTLDEFFTIRNLTSEYRIINKKKFILVHEIKEYYV